MCGTVLSRVTINILYQRLPFKSMRLRCRFLLQTSITEESRTWPRTSSVSATMASRRSPSGFFQRQADTPLHLGILVDVSDSVARRFTYEANAAAAFISQVLVSRKDLGFVVGFNERLVVAQDLTTDAQALSTAIHQLDVGGATAIYDAIYFACRKLMQNNGNSLIRRVLVLVTDGDDNSSYVHPAQAIENAVRANVTIIVLHTESDPDTSDPKYKILERLARETGGQLLPAANKKEMAKAFTQLGLQIRNSYLLAYRPAGFKRDGSYRRIQLKSTRRGIHIICRRGYYAARDNSD